MESPPIEFGEDSDSQLIEKMLASVTRRLSGVWITCLSIDAHEAEQLRQQDHGIYFNWGPDAGRYQKKIEGRRSKALDPLNLLEALQNGGSLEPQAKQTPATTE